MSSITFLGGTAFIFPFVSFLVSRLCDYNLEGKGKAGFPCKYKGGIVWL